MLYYTFLTSVIIYKGLLGGLKVGHLPIKLQNCELMSVDQLLKKEFEKTSGDAIKPIFQ